MLKLHQFKRILSAVILCSILIPLKTLSQQTYKPFKNDSLLTVALLAKASEKLEADKKSIGGENKKFIIKEYEERFGHVKGMYEKKQFITDSRAKQYIDTLVGQIIKANPVLHALKPTVLFSRMYWPNAASFGEGTIMFNISLFNRLNNESQAAFVICHELAHYYLEHSNNAIHNYINTLYSKEFQAQLREIKKNEYQKGKKLDGLLKNISYKSRRHGRDHETQADSMALELLKNCRFDVRESLTCLALLDSVDTEKYNGNLRLQEQLHFPDYPFRKSWTRQASKTLDQAIREHESANGLNKNTEETDSLKTHPDCSGRITQLKPKVDSYYKSSQQLFPINKTMFDSLVNSFDFELIEYCYQGDEVGRALYYALQKNNVEKNNLYLITMIGKCFNRIYAAQRDHMLGKITDLISDTDNSEYDSFLNFLRNLKLPDIASISYHFMKQHAPGFNSDKEFAAVYKESVVTFSSLK